MKNTNFLSRYCKGCNSNIGVAWQGGRCPSCRVSLTEWGVKIEFVLKCPACSSVITDSELCCDECGNQLPGVTIEHEQ